MVKDGLWSSVPDDEHIRSVCERGDQLVCWGVVVVDSRSVPTCNKKDYWIQNMLCTTNKIHIFIERWYF